MAAIGARLDPPEGAAARPAPMNGIAEPIKLAVVSSGLRINAPPAVLICSNAPSFAARCIARALTASSRRDSEDRREPAVSATSPRKRDAAFPAPNTSVKLLPVPANPCARLRGMSATAAAAFPRAPDRSSAFSFCFGVSKSGMSYPAPSSFLRS